MHPLSKYAAFRLRAALILSLLAAPLALLAPHGLVGGEEKASAGEKEKAPAGWLGVQIQDLSPLLREAFDIPDDQQGVVVSHVEGGSPADKAGMGRGDLIVEFSGARVSASGELVDLVRKTAPGTAVSVTVIRKGESRSLEMTLGSRAEAPRALPEALPHPPAEIPGGPRGFALRGIGGGYLGVELQDLNKDLGEYFGRAEGTGALIVKVEEEGPASEAGLKPGDVILRVGDAATSNAADVRRALRDREEGDEVKIGILRKRAEKEVTVKLGGGRHLFMGPGRGCLPGPHGGPGPRVRAWRWGDDDDEWEVEIERFREGMEEGEKALREGLEELGQGLRERRGEVLDRIEAKLKDVEERLKEIEKRLQEPRK